MLLDWIEQSLYIYVLLRCKAICLSNVDICFKIIIGRPKGA
jgi:hypothetical protein